jgi:hypothetical protein
VQRRLGTRKRLRCNVDEPTRVDIGSTTLDVSDRLIRLNRFEHSCECFRCSEFRIGCRNEPFRARWAHLEAVAGRIVSDGFRIKECNPSVKASEIPTIIEERNGRAKACDQLPAAEGSTLTVKQRKCRSLAAVLLPRA